jgi:hypothetical protein
MKLSINNPMDENKKIELLCGHYKDTSTYIKDALKLRDKLFICVLFLVTIFLFQLYSPKDYGDSISTIISSQLSTKSNIDLEFISTLLWFILLAASIKYYQTVVFIERQYDYIHSLEEVISSYFDKKAFTREGSSYLSNYPKFSDWTFFLYTIFYPLCLIFVLTVKIINEYSLSPSCTFLHIINTIFYLSILVSSILYLFLVHFKK